MTLIDAPERWPECYLPEILPPLRVQHPKVGRKKTNRRKEAEELERAKENKQEGLSRKGQRQQCQICGKPGHNKRKHRQPGGGVQEPGADKEPSKLPVSLSLQGCNFLNILN